MKLRRFLRAQVQGAFDAASISPELSAAVKALSPSEIRSILLSKDYVPLDLVSLIYHVNQYNFIQALTGVILGQLRMNTDYQTWLKEMNMTPEEAASAIYESMLEDHSNYRGALNQIILDGSRAQSYNYERAKNPARQKVLKNSLAPNKQGLVVPYCPFCAECNIKKPLWDVTIEDGKLNIKHKMPDERCNTIEKIQSEIISDEEYQQLAQSSSKIDTDGLKTLVTSDGQLLVSTADKHFKVQLTDDQQKELEEGLRSFQFNKNGLIFRCNFQAKIPSFSSFLGYQGIKQEISNLWKEFQRKHGRNISPEKYRLRHRLEEKERKGELTSDEKRQLSKLREYFNKKNIQYVPQASSLDSTPSNSTGDSKQQLQEMLSKPEEQDLSSDEANRAAFELGEVLDEDEMELLSRLSSTEDTFMQAINTYKQYLEGGSKESYSQALTETARHLLYGPALSQEPTNQCNTCGAKLSLSAKVCSHATQMQKDLYNAYLKADEVPEFTTLIAKQDSLAKAHYDAANIQKYIASLFGEIQVTEDDLFMDSSALNADKNEKLNYPEFKSRLESKLSVQERVSYNGSDLIRTEAATQSVDSKKVSAAAKIIDQLIRKVEEEDLINELVIFHYA